MKGREVVFTPEAQRDLQQLHDWIAERAGDEVALGYIQRLESYCLGLTIASQRGRRRNDLHPGLRIVGFERRVAIAFFVEPDVVVISRLHYGGKNWSRRSH